MYQSREHNPSPAGPGRRLTRSPAVPSSWSRFLLPSSGSSHLGWASICPGRLLGLQQAGSRAPVPTTAWMSPIRALTQRAEMPDYVPHGRERAGSPAPWDPIIPPLCVQ